MNTKHKIYIKVIALIGVFAVLISLFPACSSTKSKDYTSFAMGSAITAKLYGTDTEALDTVWDEICTSVKNSDNAISATNEASDIYLLNSHGSIIADDYTISLLKKVILLCSTLDRKVDITMGALTELWGFTGDNPHVPSDEEIKTALATVNLDEVAIVEGTKTISIGKNQKLDLGAFGKGEACDIMRDALLENNISACISFGGNILVTNSAPGKKGWNIGLRDPSGTENDVFASLTLSPEDNSSLCVSTSGSYEKCFEENGKKYHHIIDPSTGYPVDTNLVSVSVICTSGLNADALSTALFINGLNDTADTWLDAFKAEAVFVYGDGSVYITDGLSQNFTINNTSSYNIITYEEAISK